MRIMEMFCGAVLGTLLRGIADLFFEAMHYAKLVTPILVFGFVEIFRGLKLLALVLYIPYRTHLGSSLKPLQRGDVKQILHLG